MATVRPLLGVRYNRSLFDHIGRLVAPPYDTVADQPLSPAAYNIAKLENVRLGDSVDPHQLAAARYHDWRASHVLVQEPSPRFYVHDHGYRIGAESVTRRGLFARLRLAAWSDGIVLPHEQTFDGPRRERLLRLRAVEANLSPLYLLYRDPNGVLQSILRTAINETPAILDGVDPTGGTHRLFSLSDPALQQAIEQFFTDRRLYIADGHHRYEAALAYRDERRAASGMIDPEAPPEFVLVLLAAATDPGVQVLPTHRLVTGLPAVDPVQVRHDLEKLFNLDPIDDHAAALDSPLAGSRPPVVCHVLFPDDPRPWAVRTRSHEPHRPMMSPGRGSRWQRFGAAIVDDVIVRHTLGIDADQTYHHLTYTHDTETARAAVATGDAHMALLLPPPSLEALMTIADEGDRLPPKSTYFEPKAAAGLVINDVSSPVPARSTSDNDDDGEHDCHQFRNDDKVGMAHASPPPAANTDGRNL